MNDGMMHGQSVEELACGRKQARPTAVAIAVVVVALVVMAIALPGCQSHQEAGVTEVTIPPAETESNEEAVEAEENAADATEEGSSEADAAEDAASEDPASDETEAAEASAEESAEPELTPEEEFIESLDGWWEKATGGGDSILCYIHDGVLELYSYDGQKLEGGRTYEPGDVERMEGGIGGGAGQYTAGPGWFIYGPDHNTYGSYVSDDDPNFMQNINIDGSGYTSGNALARIDSPEWAAEVEG